MNVYFKYIHIHICAYIETAEACKPTVGLYKHHCIVYIYMYIYIYIYICHISMFDLPA